MIERDQVLCGLDRKGRPLVPVCYDDWESCPPSPSDPKKNGTGVDVPPRTLDFSADLFAERVEDVETSSKSNKKADVLTMLDAAHTNT